MPYTAVIPASSQCTTYSSAQLYTGEPTASASLSGTSSPATATAIVTKAVASTVATSTAASTSKASGAAAAFNLGGFWTVAAGVVAAAVGAVVAL